MTCLSAIFLPLLSRSLHFHCPAFHILFLHNIFFKTDYRHSWCCQSLQAQKRPPPPPHTHTHTHTHALENQNTTSQSYPLDSPALPAVNDQSKRREPHFSSYYLSPSSPLYSFVSLSLSVALFKDYSLSRSLSHTLSKLP